MKILHAEAQNCERVFTFHQKVNFCYLVISIWFFNHFYSLELFSQWKWKSLSHVRLFAIPWNSPGQNTGVDSRSLLQGIFSTQGLNLGLPHCKQILYQLSHHGSPRILEWVTYPFPRESSWSRNWTRISCIAGGFFTSWVTREILKRFISQR